MTQEIIQVETLHLLRDIQRSMRSRNLDSSNGVGGGNIRNGGNNNSSNSTYRRNYKTPDDATFERCIKNKYYWMHG